MIEPEMWAIPEVITVISSERVIRGRNGRIVSGASVCPMKIEAATFRLSAPLAPMTRLITTREGAHDHLHDPEVVHDREQSGDEDDGGQDLEGEDHAEARVRLAQLAEYELRSGVGVSAGWRSRHSPSQRNSSCPAGTRSTKIANGHLEPEPPGHHAPADRSGGCATGRTPMPMIAASPSEPGQPVSPGWLLSRAQAGRLAKRAESVGSWRACSLAAPDRPPSLADQSRHHRSEDQGAAASAHSARVAHAVPALPHNGLSPSQRMAATPHLGAQRAPLGPGKKRAGEGIEDHAVDLLTGEAELRCGRVQYSSLSETPHMSQPSVQSVTVTPARSSCRTG